MKSEDLKAAECPTAQTYSEGFVIHRMAASLEMSSLAAHGFQGTFFSFNITVIEHCRKHVCLIPRLIPYCPFNTQNCGRFIVSYLLNRGSRVIRMEQNGPEALV